jgi:hypothetical protein
MLAVAIPSSPIGAVPELTTAPDSVEWVLARLAWLLFFAGALLVIGRFTRRFEVPWTGASRARRVAAAGLAAAFALYAFGWGSSPADPRRRVSERNHA